MDQTVRNGYNETVRQMHIFVLSLVSLVPDFIEKFSVNCEGDSNREQLLNFLVAACYQSYAAASRALGISVKVVKKRIHRLSWGNARLHLLGTLEEDLELVARLAATHGYEAWPYFMQPETKLMKALDVSPELAAVMAEEAVVQRSTNSVQEHAGKAGDQLLEQRVRNLIMARMLLEPEFAEKVIAAYTQAPDVLRESLLGCSIDPLGFSTRTRKCLKKEDIDTLGQLIEQTEEGLLEIRNFGKRSLKEVIDKLAELELKLKESPPLAP